MKKRISTGHLLTALMVPFVITPSALAADAHALEMDEAKIQPMADLAEAQRAKQALERFIQAYEQGDIPQIRNMLDSSMIGYQAFLDGVRRDHAAYKQMRIHFYDTKVLAGPDVTVIRTKWEKRYLSSLDLQPGMQTGQSMFLLHDTVFGWKVAALAGDNVIASLGGSQARGGALGQVRLSPAVFAGTGFTGVIPVQAEVYDPDLAGTGSLNVEFLTAQNDREVFSLTETTPGRFTSTTLNIQGQVAPPTGGGVTIIQNDGVLRIETTFGVLPTTVTMRYVDKRPGHFLQQRTTSATMQVQ